MSDHGHGKMFYRLTLNQRIQHVVIMITFSMVVMTGFSLKFHGASWTYPLIKTFGGVFMAGRIHRASGVLLVGNFFYVLFYIILTTIPKVQQVFKEKPPANLKERILGIIMVIYGLPMVPDANDGRNIVDFLRYAFFLSDKRPLYGKFQWKEKFDYLAVFWGTLAFLGTGPILWFPSFWANLGIPAFIINIALIVHSDEALLAAGVIYTWHLYNVALSPEKFPMYGTMLDGCLDEHLMMEEYPAEYIRIMIEDGENSPSIVQTSHGHGKQH
ncbi:MAG: hypothetical protein HZA78_06785 [Candidatus Schekmanbacteria bacterium]|nr:hypothetical protein [Candidatus Schekmanbacteria bacterium]